SKPGRHICGTPCTHSTCKSGNRAFVDRRTNILVACPDLKDEFKTVVETIMHEAVHGATFQGEDAAYLYEPLFPFLSTDAALQNPDSFVEFTRVIKGRPTAPRPPTGGFHSSFSDEDRRAVDKAVAWAMKHLLAAGAGVDNVYRVLAAAQQGPQGAAELAGIADEREIFKRHFGTTGPTQPSKPEDQWRVNGVSDRINKLIVTSGQQPEVVRGEGVVWSIKTKRLRVDKRFFKASVSDQARQIAWALIVDAHDIPAHRRVGYLNVIDALGGSDVSATEGTSAP
ncbi:MAG: hypothetical protein LC799_22405, partial [Actinobacteria bacterium]|nr:hypothetical protein [Actinomycetota bacterium]